MLSIFPTGTWDLSLASYWVVGCALLAVDLQACKHCCSVLCKSCPASFVPQTCNPVRQQKVWVAEQSACLRNHCAAVGSGYAAKWE